MPEEETIESLTEVTKGLMEILSTHAVMLAHIMRALDDAQIEVPGLMHPSKLVN